MWLALFALACNLPCFVTFRSTEFSTELNRFMERCFVESRALDVESLCIVAGEKVINIKFHVFALFGK